MSLDPLAHSLTKYGIVIAQNTNFQHSLYVTQMTNVKFILLV